MKITQFKCEGFYFEVLLAYAPFLKNYKVSKYFSPSTLYYNDILILHYSFFLQKNINTDILRKWPTTKPYLNELISRLLSRDNSERSGGSRKGDGRRLGGGCTLVAPTASTRQHWGGTAICRCLIRGLHVDDTRLPHKCRARRRIWDCLQRGYLHLPFRQ